MHQHEVESLTSNKEKLWLWYIIGVFITLLFWALLEFLPAYRSLWLLSFSLLILVDAILIKVHGLGKNNSDSIFWFVVYGILGLGGIVISTIYWQSMSSWLHETLAMSSIAFVVGLLTVQVIRSIVTKRNKV